MKPRFARIIWTDWPALFCLVVIPIIWFVAFALPLLKRSAGSELIAVAAAISTAATLMLSWRILRIRAFFANGVETRAQITEIHLVKDRGRIHFKYTHAGKEMHAWMPVHKTKSTLALQQGSTYDALLNPKRPGSAIIRHLF